MFAGIRKKLNSKSGVSMIVALVFFMVCAVVGGIVLTASSVSAGKTARDKQSQRSYLAVASAARLVMDDFADLRFNGAYSYVEQTVTTVNSSDVDGEAQTSTAVTSSSHYTDGGTATGFAGTGKLLPVSGIDLSALYYGSLPEEIRASMPVRIPTQQTCELSFAGNDELSIPAVTGLVTIGTDYAMTVVLQDAQGESRLCLSYTPSVSKPELSAVTALSESGSTATETVTTTYTTIVTWGSPIVSREGGAA